MTISPKTFAQQCKRRFGIANPERMRIEHWEWMVRRGDDPYGVRKEIGLEREGLDDGPDWCFDRFGMSRTAMPDGRVICIAGEHEDSYDPDFCVYNDLIVLRPAANDVEVTLDSGEVEIYGYPDKVFPPTDFHSATLVGSSIYLIGRLGYEAERRRILDITPVFKVDANNYKIEEVETTGAFPGWIFEHRASYDAQQHAIVVRGGIKFERDSITKTINHSSYRLLLTDLRWEIIPNREDEFAYGLEAMDKGRPISYEPVAEDFRIRAVPYAWLPPQKGVIPQYNIAVAGARVKFDCICSSIEVSIDGEIPHDLVTAVLNDVATNLANSSGVEWRIAKRDAEH